MLFKELSKDYPPKVHLWVQSKSAFEAASYSECHDLHITGFCNSVKFTLRASSSLPTGMQGALIALSSTLHLTLRMHLSHLLTFCESHFSMEFSI